MNFSIKHFHTVYLKAVFSFGYLVVLFGLLYLRLQKILLNYVIQSRQVTISVREARHISEPVVVIVGYLKISEIVVKECCSLHE